MPTLPHSGVSCKGHSPLRLDYLTKRGTARLRMLLDRRCEQLLYDISLRNCWASGGGVRHGWLVLGFGGGLTRLRLVDRLLV